MAPMVVDPARVREFVDFQAFHDWLAAHHDREPEIWIRMHRKSSGLASIDWGQAVDAALCWGWIDGVRKSLDATSFLQRLTPRGPKSSWSKINVDKVAALTESGLMTAHGLKHVEAAKADGRWDAAYRVKGAEVPADLQAAIDADPAAAAMFAVLSSQNRFALIFRTEQMKTPAGRARKIADLTAMLARGETPHPQKARP
ncbi:MAG: YdeI/OmpD-associated family protein [Brevundimonas sp.]